MNQYRRVVEPSEDIPAEKMNLLFHDLLERLGLCVVVEETPDYTAYSIESKNTDN
jgi:hypothetical protein